MKRRCALFLVALAPTGCGDTIPSQVAGPPMGADGAVKTPGDSSTVTMGGDAGALRARTPPDASSDVAARTIVDATTDAGLSEASRSPLDGALPDGSSDVAARTVADASNPTDGGVSEASRSLLDSALPDASASVVATLAIFLDGGVEEPLSCPTSKWEFPGPPSSNVYLRNTSSVPLAYIAEPMWVAGGDYVPGVPTGTSGEKVGLLQPGAGVYVSADFYSDGVCPIAVVGSPKPFSIPDGGYTTFDEKTMAWPDGVPNSTGAPTMYLAFLEFDSSCSAVSWQ